MTKQERLNQLLDAGKSMEDALTILVEEFAPQPIKNRIAHIEKLNNIDEVRLMIKRAHGKKSKSEKEETKAKYQKEIDAGYKRLNYLLAQAEENLTKLIELGEVPVKVLHRWIRSRESELKATIEKMEGTRNSKKDLVNAQPVSTPKSIKEELKAIHPDLVEVYEDRVKRNDQGCIAINRKQRVLEKVK